MDFFNFSFINTALNIMSQLHFIRAFWLYAFIPLVIFIFLSYINVNKNSNWSKVVDPKLLKFILKDTNRKPKIYPLLLAFIAASLAIFALAGPVYKKLPQPVYRLQSSLIVVLDLSQSMDAKDIKPTRLERAKLKLLDLLKTRKTGQTALIVYAADAFVVTPLTDDNATIANLIPSLTTNMMPAQGSYLTSALAKSFLLFNQAGVVKGDVLVVTDGIKSQDEAAINKFSSQGHRLSILGVGTADGAPISVNGDFLLDKNGAIVVPKLNANNLHKLALRGHGLYHSLQTDDSDIIKLSALFDAKKLSNVDKREIKNADVWHEEGVLLLLPLLLLTAFWARKGWIALLLVFYLPYPIPAQADTSTTDKKTFGQFLWSTPDQQAMREFKQGRHEKAAKNFTHPLWKASSYYRAGNYQASVDVLKKPETSLEFYNKANALTRLGKLEQAVKNYDDAIKLNANNDDAIFNRKLVQEKIKQQQKKQQKQKNDKNDKNEQDNENKNSKQQNKKSQNSEQQNKQDGSKNKQSSNEENKQEGEENKSSDKNSEQSEKQSEQKPEEQNKTDKEKQAENEQLKKRDAKKEAQKQKKELEQYQKEQQQDKNNKAETVEINPTPAQITEEEKSDEQWLKRIPDDPGGLLRRKFHYQYKNNANRKNSDEPW